MAETQKLNMNAEKALLLSAILRLDFYFESSEVTTNVAYWRLQNFIGYKANKLICEPAEANFSFVPKKELGGQDARILGATWLALEGCGQGMEAPIGSTEVSIDRSECSGDFDTKIS